MGVFAWYGPNEAQDANSAATAKLTNGRLRGVGIGNRLSSIKLVLMLLVNLKSKFDGKLGSMQRELIKEADTLITKIIVQIAVTNLRKDVAGNLAA